MSSKKKIAAICGSTRSDSSNHLLLRALVSLLSTRTSSSSLADITIFDSIAGLPHFNPDLDTDLPPAEVSSFRNFLRSADGILICTPEYAHGVPGSLKNAIDWTVSSCEFSHKPTALITASTDGRFGHQALLETLRVIEAADIDRLQLIIPFVRTKLNADGTFADGATESSLRALLERFVECMNSLIHPIDN
jgi:NAD(P)H-dependent FMN reductase